MKMFIDAIKRQHSVMQPPIEFFVDALFRFRAIYYFAGRLMSLLCLHKVKKSYKVDYASKDKSNKKTCFN